MRYMIPLAAILFAAPLTAQDISAFTMGPVFEDFGPVADVEADFRIPDGAEFHVAFDAAEGAEDGAINRTFISAARLINMHARAGVEPVNNRAAIVVHGGAVFDVLDDEAWAAKGREGSNGSAQAIRQLIDQGVRIIVCGQSATASGVANEDLLLGVEMALSAMTAHALLQQQGYTVNPF